MATTSSTNTTATTATISWSRAGERPGPGSTHDQFTVVAHDESAAVPPSTGRKVDGNASWSRSCWSRVIDPGRMPTAEVSMISNPKDSAFASVITMPGPDTGIGTDDDSVFDEGPAARIATGPSMVWSVSSVGSDCGQSHIAPTRSSSARSASVKPRRSSSAEFPTGICGSRNSPSESAEGSGW